MRGEIDSESGPRTVPARPSRIQLTILGAASLSGCAGVLLTAGSSTAVAQTIKPPIVSLVDMGSQATYHQEEPFPTVNTAEVTPDAPAFSGIVVNETWAQLEPSSGQFTFGPLDDSLAAVQAYNSANPADPLAVKLRIFGGFTAPDWAKTMDGSPISVPQTDAPGGSDTVGQWWKPDYEAAWSTFQHALAAQYDSNPLIRSVAVTSCASTTGEPFVLNHTSSVVSQMLADGYSDAAEQACLQGAFSDYSGWQQTPIDYTFNPFISISPTTKQATNSMPFTDSVMTSCADLQSTKGRTCILANHDLETATGSSTPELALGVYDEIDSLYAANPGQTQVALQTYAPDNFGGCDAIGAAVYYHAQSVELWPATSAYTGYSAFSEPALAGWAQSLADGTPPSC